MSNAGFTPRLNLTLPTPGLSDNVWGYELNDTINLLDQVVVSRDGDAMLGPFTLYQDPIGVLDAVPKRYVDARTFDMAHVAMDDYAQAGGGAGLFAGSPAGAGVYSWNNRTGDVSLTLADVTGVGGLSAAAAASTYLPLAGGNLTGQLTVNGKLIAAPILADDIISGGIVASWSSGYDAAMGFQFNHNSNRMDFGGVNQSANLLTSVLMHLNADGSLTLGRGPAGALDAATKQYVDTAIGAGGIYVDAPVDGFLYGRVNSGWTRTLPLAGGNLTGQLSINGKLIAAPILANDVISGGIVASWSSGYDVAMGFQFNHTSSRMDFGVVDQASSTFTALLMTLSTAGGLKVTGGLGAFGVNAPTVRPAVTGSRAGNAAVASLLTALAATGLISDGTVA
jgi:putative AlgH/UPF0301 family transcriptional regulator